jgi:hypothetical protein
MTEQKLNKLMDRVERLVADLNKNKAIVNGAIDPFFYMQKIEAMKRQAFVEGDLETEHRLLFCRWKKEVRWLNKRIAEQHREKRKPIL